MQEWSDEGFLLSSRPHGESAAVAQVLTRSRGRWAGRVRGGQSRLRRGVLLSGNRLEVRWRARLSEQLGHFSLEPLSSPAARFFRDGDRLAALSSALSLLEACLPEREPHARSFDSLSSLLAGFARPDWSARYLAWERDLLAELGYGLPRACDRLGAGAWLDPLSWRVVPAESGGARNGRATPGIPGSSCGARAWLRLPSALFAAPSSSLSAPSGRASGRAPERVEVAEALEFLGRLFALRLFHPVGHEVPAARLRLARRFSSSPPA